MTTLIPIQSVGGPGKVPRPYRLRLSTTNRTGTTLHSDTFSGAFNRSIILFSGLIALVLAGLFACSTIDPATDVGTAILQAQDPTITNFNQNIRAIKTRLKILNYSSFSDTSIMAKIMDPAVHQNSDTAYLGTWWNELSTIYLEVKASEVLERLNTISTSTHLKAKSMCLKFYIDSADAGHTDSIMASFCPIRTHNKPVNRFSAIPDLFAQRVSDTTGMILYNIERLDSSTLASETNTAYWPKDTIFKIDSITGKMIEPEITFDSTKAFYKPISFLITYDGPLLKMPSFASKKPALGIICSNDSTNIDTIHYIDAYYEDYSVEVIGRDVKTITDAAITSNTLGRTAVLKVDLKPFWALMFDTLTGERFQNIQQLKLTIPIDSADSRSTSIVYSGILKDTLFSTLAFYDKLADPSSTLKRDSLINPFEKQLTMTFNNLNPLVSRRPDTGYLYGVPGNSSFQKIIWGRNANESDSLEIEAVISNPDRN
jgi:hypothetical protein